MKPKIILLLALILGGLLRFYNLGKNPPSLNLDEVAIGYNAYSVLKTGRDEYGERFPLAFRSHDDYKPPLYIYLTVPSVALFGLNEFAVRFPSASAGTLTIFLTFLLTIELLRKELGVKKATNIAIISAFLLAINPWHLQFSRAGFETNVAVCLVVLGIWAFLRGISGKTKWWYLSAISFALSIYTYQTARFFIPLFSLALAVIFVKPILKKKKEALKAVLLFLIIILPLIPTLTSTAGLMRFKGTSVFEHPGLIDEEAQRVLSDTRTGNRLASKLYHNRLLAAFITVTNGYLKHFRPDLLFLGFQGPPVNYTPNVGLLYFIELTFIFWGLHRLANLKDKQSKALIFSWFLLSPLASSLTWDVPSSTRMTIILPTFQIFAALGIDALIHIKNLNKKIHKLALCLVAIIYSFSLGRYLHQYHVHAPIEYSQAWQYGYKQAVQFIQERLDEYDRVIVSTHLKQPQNFFAFYTKYNPWTYIFIDGGTVSGGFLETENKFGKFEFHPIDYFNLDFSQNLLLVDLYDKMPEEYKQKIIKLINLPSGEPKIAISKT